MRPDLTTVKQFHSMQSQAPLVEVTECFSLRGIHSMHIQTPPQSMVHPIRATVMFVQCSKSTHPSSGSCFGGSGGNNGRMGEG